MKRNFGLETLCLIVAFLYFSHVDAVSEIRREVNCFPTDPPSRWREDCNWCSCSKIGVGICTLRGCLPGANFESVPECEGAARWKKDPATWCSCENGTSVCSSSTKPEASCFPSETPSGWRVDCNWCSCSDSGVGICSFRGCLPNITYEDVADCHGMARWKTDYTTWCSCENGTAVCSPSTKASGVVKESDYEEKSCRYTDDKSRWRNSCNWCHCPKTENGFCTTRACLLGATFENVPDCEGVARWKEDSGNWCSCENGTAVCSPATQVSGDVQRHSSNYKGKSCQYTDDKSRWSSSCNWCHCPKTENAFCTTRACIAGFGKAAPECEGTASWRKDACTWCNCVDGKENCKHVECDLNEKEVSCFPSDPPSRWRKNCNWCSCSKTGVGMCTLRGCLLGATYENVPDCEGAARWKEVSGTWCSCENGTAVCSPSTTNNPANREDCIENSSWVEDCNTCYCRKGTVFCTIHDCSTEINVINAAVLDDENKFLEVVHSIDAFDARSCKIGSRFKTDRCNWCTCSESGKSAYCTMMACFHNGDLLDKTPICEGGAMWKEDCNICGCLNGQAICSNIDCRAHESLRSLASTPLQHSSIATVVPPPSDVKCIEGSKWLTDCNWCNCIRGNDFCTQVACETGREVSKKKCENGSQWRIDACTWCVCMNEVPECVQHDCPGQMSPPPAQTEALNAIVDIPNAVCTRGSRWKEGCNWCNCLNGIGLCSLSMCLPEEKLKEHHICEGRSEWKQDACNWCTCKNGAGICSDKPCGKGDARHLRYECQSGNAWREGCDYCKCVDGVSVCAKGHCRSISETEKKACKEGNEWNDSCNVCRCVDGEILCTRRACAIQELQDLPYICSLPAIHPDTEHCEKGIEMKWTFNVEREDCERIFFRGCGGTENLFQSLASCRSTCSRKPSTSSTGSLCDSSKCDWIHFSHYLSKTCEPLYDADACCPTSFDCSNFAATLSASKCYYKDQEYAIGNKVPVEDPCSAGCRCTDAYLPGLPAEIRCANVECPSLFVKLMPGCRRLYRINECCSYDEECVGSTLHPLPEVRVPKCKWGGRTYSIGDRMYFDDHPCQKCVCTPEFTDAYGPGCDKVNCGFDFRYTSRFAGKCTPIYFENKCCPVDWLCPGSSNITVTLPTTDKIYNGNLQCLFGDTIVPLGSLVEVEDCRVHCSCKTPPELTCIMKRSCLSD